MTAAQFFCALVCLFLGQKVQQTSQELSMSFRQEKRFMSAEVGDTLTLQCFYKGDSAWLYWYKQSLGQTPKLISIFYVYDRKITFQDEFKDDRRFRLSTENSTNHLIISNLRISDSANYYCARSYTFVLNFTEGILVYVQGSGLKIPAAVYQSESESVQPGDSVTLNCTVQPGTCEGEHSVFWFKNSQESHSPGLIYTNRGRNNQCEKKPNTGSTRTCVFNLPLKSLNLSHTGIYYCAVASCGRILFGNGTKLDSEYKIDPFVLVYILSGALTITTILVVFLSFTIYKKIKSNPCQCTGKRTPSNPLKGEKTGSSNDDDLHYAALSVNKPRRSGRHSNTTESMCVYSSVRQ
ncbi:uncharacterized protein LOC117807493 [Xyrichtys novacula]|uniref:Uncharacterized protein LOC117807493 n=1 Tax=Xyrichtys novacula TaxID=13765 RepID=A0AAV1HLB5_XYRNO|nr:uncharacterized protein LOC117807493 [Xyrichtys novacula]